MNRARVRIAILAIPMIGLGLGFGCLGQAERTYFDDLDASADATVVFPPEGSAETDSAKPDAMGMPGDDAPESADGPDGVGPIGDAGTDSPEAAVDCGPTNTVANCGSCGAACDTAHGSATGCTAGACQYTCSSGWGDCQPSAPDLNGCETPLNTAQNCSNCGIACDTTHSLDAGCSGTSCTYSACAAGYVDCHTTAPNADGCECNAPACCEAGVCEPLHDNGQGQNYYDCTPLGSYSSALALKACIAYTGSAAECVSFPCKSGTGDGPIICSSGAVGKNCMCWSFAGNDIGLVDNGGVIIPPLDSGVAAKCFCPDIASGDTPWN
jgi:hypothetical protein